LLAKGPASNGERTWFHAEVIELRASTPPIIVKYTNITMEGNDAAISLPWPRIASVLKVDTMGSGGWQAKREAKREAVRGTLQSFFTPRGGVASQQGGSDKRKLSGSRLRRAKRLKEEVRTVYIRSFLNPSSCHHRLKNVAKRIFPRCRALLSGRDVARVRHDAMDGYRALASSSRAGSRLPLRYH
jgi:hypothetical protein